MRKTKILIFLLTTIVLLTTIQAKAAIGYTYNHKGEAIYSTIGLTVNQDPYIASTLGINPVDFTSPEDMFVYKDKLGNETIYIVDSVSNKLFVFDGNFVLQDTVSDYKLTIDQFSLDELSKIKSDKDYVVARNTFFLQNIDSALGKAIITTEPVTIEVAEMRWKNTNDSIAKVEQVDGVDYVIAQGAGQTTVIAEFYTANDLLKETPIPTISQTYKVIVTDEVPGSIIDPTKTNGFSEVELNNMTSFQLKLSNVVCVYRSVIEKTGEDYIYLCDKGNNQIVVIDAITYEIVKFVTVPDDISFEGINFSPEDVITDITGRMYVIADNIFEGIIQFSVDGIFNRFTGVNYVTLSAWEIFWRNISTESQLAKQSSIINTSFTSMCTNSDGFIYSTSYAITNDDGIVTDDNSMIKLINTSGKDVIRRNGYQSPKGDVIYIRSSTASAVRGPSKLSGITANEYGIYTVVDSKMGKLFTYDYEGNLLYISGQPLYISSDRGSQIDTLSNPVAITYHGEELLVLDKNNKAILVYENTDIGALINQAVQYEYVGDSENAALVWQEVVKQNSNYEYAYIGIGKMYRKNKDYEKAMEYFKIGADKDAYSRAFKLYRDAKIRQAFPYIAGGVFAIVGAKITYNLIKYKRFRKVREGADDSYD
ncbi:MAG: hypothetical protein WCQ80_02375 [Bacilli bacterium]